MGDTLEGADQLPLIGAAEIAVILGVDRRDVYDLTRSRDWPEPLARFTSGSVWKASDVRHWLQAHADTFGSQPVFSRPGASQDNAVRR